MTAKELIDHLSQLPAETIILVGGEEGSHAPNVACGLIPAKGYDKECSIVEGMEIVDYHELERNWYL